MSKKTKNNKTSKRGKITRIKLEERDTGEVFGPKHPMIVENRKPTKKQLRRIIGGNTFIED